VQDRLSVREAEVVAHRARGFTVKETAAHLGIAVSTVKTHLARIYLKLDVVCSVDLVRWVQDHRCQNCPYRRAKGKGRGL
jgi:DNA-binding CsgD family transcriptional regulator